MDRRVRYIMGLDTETCNGLTDGQGKSDLSQSIVYDVGWTITDKQGHIYVKRSFVIYETFVGMKDIMQSAYYAEKIPMYWEQIKGGQRKLVKFATMYHTFLSDLKEWNCNTVFAHNARFDVNALNNTIRYVTKSKNRWFFPYKTEIWDTLKMCRQTIGKQKSYRDWCFHNNYVTKHKSPQVRLTAEIIYRYITGCNDFVESHTGLEDTLIETKIMVHCFRQHKKMDKALFSKKRA